LSADAPAALWDEGPPPPCPARFNMAAHTLAAALRSPEKTALEVLAAPGVSVERWTYAALADAVLRTAGGLAAQGLRRGDRVLLRLGATSDFPRIFFAANALGAVPVPVSSQLTAAEVAAVIADLEPRLVCLGAGLALDPAPGAPVLGPDALAALADAPPACFAETRADDPAYMVYTSGASGRPKGVVHAQRAAWARRMMWTGWYGLTPEDRVLHAGAFNWTYTLGAGITDPWAIGATALIYAGPADRTVWPRLAAAHCATIFAAVPGVYRQMLETGDDLARGFAGLRHGLSAGEALPDSVRDGFAAATGKAIYEAIGMTEVSTYASFAPGRPPRPGRVGRPQHGRRVAILREEGEGLAACGEEGLLAVSRRDPGLMLGYWRRPAETDAAFRGEWFVTGDRARMDPDGALEYLGRADDLITAGGFRISPLEVEAALAAHPGVTEAAAAALEVRPGVRVIAAWYVPRGAPVPEAELAAHCAARLAAWKRPRAFRHVDELPRSANGKLLRRQLGVA